MHVREENEKCLNEVAEQFSGTKVKLTTKNRQKSNTSWAICPKNMKVQD